MDSQFIRQVFSAASVGSLLILSALPANAGRIFRDQPDRPHIPAACQPAWGFHQTCWSRFPALPPCDSNGDSFADPLNPQSHWAPAGVIYSQQPGLVSEHGYPPTAVPGWPEGTYPQSTPSEGMPGAMPFPMQNGMRYAPPSGYPAQQNALGQFHGDLHSAPVEPAPVEPAPIPSIEPGSIPEEQGTPLELPPLPAPPTTVPPVPGQTRSTHEQLIFGADGRLTTASAASTQSQRVSASRHSQQAVAAARPNTLGAYVSPAAGPNASIPKAIQNVSARYGSARRVPAVTAGQSRMVEPLRKTPESYR